MGAEGDNDEPSTPKREKGGTVVMQAVIRPQSDSSAESDHAPVASTVAIPAVSEPPRPSNATKQSALAMTTCPTCNVATPVAKFCSDCGAPLTPRRFCSECGGRLQPGAKYCDSCGERVP